MLGAEVEDYPFIGPYGAEEENANGTHLRELCEKFRMVAVNTTQSQPSGKTWFGGKGYSSRVDYILVSEDRIGASDRAILSHEMHRRLKTLVGLDVRDHVPLCWDFQYAPWTQSDEEAKG